LLTGDVALSLSKEQGTALAAILSDVKSRETLTDDEASVLSDSILALFDDDQKAKQDAIGLPFRRGGQGGGPGGGGRGDGGETAEDANPFAEERDASALDSLLERFGKPAEEKPDSTPSSTDDESKEPVTEERETKDASAKGDQE
jgi:hypothetical protein